MFKRRQKYNWKERFKNNLWPQIGWKRFGQYLMLKLYRMKGTPYSLAAGTACGVAISFTPFVGFHFVLAAVSAWIVRGNILASALGTAAGNPWTFPFIWVSVLYTGRHILYGKGNADQAIDFMAFFEKAGHAILNLDLQLFFQDIWPILWPMMIGSIPFYITSWIISYFLIKRALDNINNKYSLIKKDKV